MKEVNLDNLTAEKNKEISDESEKTVEEPQLEKTNLLKTRKSCVKQVQDIEHLIEVDSPIMTFGHFMSGQNLGN